MYPNLTGIIIALLPFAAILVILMMNSRRPSVLNPVESPKSDLPRVIPRDQHPVSRRELSDNALKVLYRLKDAGYDSYLVGGCVRDILLDKHPKDFDVATEAHPEQVHELFRNSRLIGRRFKLVHVRFGREIIEVATFRASHDSNDKSGQQSEGGMLLRDNVYGTVIDDALRRDFTVNALYYSVKDFAIHDYANGLEDLNNRTLRMIGDPEARYREDPVRMLRAVRFAAKLQFSIEPGTEEPIKRLADLLGNIPAARLFEEVLKLFLSGDAETTFELLREFELFGILFPATEHALQLFELNPKQQPDCEALLRAAFRSTDSRVRQGKSVTPAFIYAALLWHPMQRRMGALQAKGLPAVPALHQASQEIILEQIQSTTIPRRFSQPMREIWELQLRLPRRTGRRPEQTFEHPRFRAAYDFLLMREIAGEDLDGLGEWWTQYQLDHAPATTNYPQHAEREHGNDNDESRTPKRRRRRRRSKPATGNND